MAGGGDFLASGGDDVGFDSGSEDDSVRSIGSDTLDFFFGGPILVFWPQEEPAPTMVSDLLVLKRLGGGLMGASSTRGEMTCGRRGSEVEPWIGVALGILRRVDGDEDLAPRVLAMAVLEKMAKGARGLLRRRRQTGGCSGLAPLGTFLKFKLPVRIGKMEFIPFKRDAKGHCSFSQQGGNFAAGGGFRRGGHFCNIFVAHFAATK